MAVNIITQEDLDQFKVQFFEEQKLFLEQFKTEISGNPEKQQSEPITEKWIKSYQVQRMLNISAGTLQTFRTNGIIPFSKIGGSIFYSLEDVQKVLEHNKRKGF